MKNLITLCIFGILFYSNSNSANAQSYSLETGMAPFSFLEDYEQLDSGNVFSRKIALHFVFPNSLENTDTLAFYRGNFRLEQVTNPPIIWDFQGGYERNTRNFDLQPTDSSLVRIQRDSLSLPKSLTYEIRNFTLNHDPSAVISQSFTIFENGDVLVHFGQVEGNRQILDTVEMVFGQNVYDFDKEELLEFNYVVGPANAPKLIHDPTDFGNGLEGLPEQGRFYRFKNVNNPTAILEGDEIQVSNINGKLIFNKSPYKFFEINIFDVKGTLIKSQNLIGEQTYNYSNDIHHAGIYLIQIVAKDGSRKTFKVAVNL
jgi:hypothetical protein